MSKVWFITGAGRGIGAEIAQAALKAGDRVVAAARSLSQLPTTLASADPARVALVELDVAQEAQAPAAIDVLVNNAAYGLLGNVEELAPHDIAHQFRVDVFGVMHVLRAALPVLRKQRAGTSSTSPRSPSCRAWPNCRARPTMPPEVHARHGARSTGVSCNRQGHEPARPVPHPRRRPDRPAGRAARHACARLAQLGRVESHRIGKVVDWIRRHDDQPIRIDDMAALAHLSPSSLHEHFKSLTSMSPLQFQKTLRLQEARRLMLSTGMDAGLACQRVGYASPCLPAGQK